MKVRLKVYEWLSKAPQASPKVVFTREVFVTEFNISIAVLNELFCSDDIRFYTFEFSTIPHKL